VLGVVVLQLVTFPFKLKRKTSTMKVFYLLIALGLFLPQVTFGQDGEA